MSKSLTLQVSQTMRSARSRSLAALLLALLAQLAFGPAADAQGTMGQVPDPITSRDLDDYARRLALSAQQRGAIEQFHEAYKAQFAALRDNEIEKFLSGSTSNAGGGRGPGGGGGGGRAMGMLFGNTDRKSIEDAQRQLNSINERIKGLDNSLFDQIQGLLIDDQIVLLTGVRQTRERQRYRTGLSRVAGFSNPSTQVDLTELMANLTLSADEKTNASPIITTYETSLTSATKKLHDDAAESTVTMLDKLEKLGFTSDTMQDPNRRGEMFEAFRTVWGEITAKINERASEISGLNRRTERSLVAVLAAENSRKLRDNFFRRAYPELRVSSNTARAYEVALTFEDLTEDQRAAITAMHDQYLDSLDRLNEQLADEIDAQRKTRSGIDFGGGGRGGPGGGRGGQGGGENSDTMQKLRDQRSQLVDASRQQMEALLGPEKTEQLQKRVAEAREQQREDRTQRTATFITVAPAGGAAIGGATAITATFNGDEITVDGQGPSRDPFVPAAISDRDVEAYAKRLALNDDARTILSGLHDEYSDRFKQIDDTDIQAVRDASENLWQRGDGDRPTPPTADDVDRLYSLRRQAIAAIKTLDEQFFNDVQVAVLSEEQHALLDRVRQSRLRAIYNRGTGEQGMFNMGGGGGGRGGRGGPGGGGPGRMFVSGFGGSSSESNVDLSVLIEQSKIAANDPKALDTTLAEYEAAATAAFQIMFENNMRLRQSTDRMAGQFMRGGGGGDRGGNAAVAVNGDSIRQTMETEGKAAREASAAMTTLNRDSLERVVAQLDATNADALRRAYNKKAFPDIYRDRRSAQPRIDSALALPDLTDQQRDQLQTMAFEYRTAYDALCEQMITLEKSNAAAPTGGGGQGAGGAGFDFQAIQERMRNREKLDFERNDLSDKMLARLRATLNEEQVRRLGLELNGGS